MGRLDGKVAIIAGGAVGIGGADSRLFAQEGAKVVIGDLREEDGQKLADEINKKGGEAIFVKHDISKEADWKNIIKKTVEKFGKVNILVNNAGVSLGKDVVDTTLEDWNWVMGINATGVFLGMKYGIDAMKDSKEKCSIINRSSIDGQVGEAGLFAYCASKGAVTIATKSAMLGVCERGWNHIRINSVHPGYVHTALTEKEAADSGMTNDAYFAYVGEQHPIGYIGEAIDIAYLDVYLASDESKFCTGAEFTIDGGWTAK